MTASLRSQFYLSKEITHLNHGSFGACPKPIFEDYQQWQLELEKNTVNFYTREAPGLLQQSRQALGDFIGCAADDVVFTSNPSYAMNIIAKSFPLQPGDEILTTNLEYGAMDKTWEYYCTKAGALYVRQEIALPLQSKAEVVAQFFEGLSSKTKAIFISHLTSSTALLLPVEEICAQAKKLGLITLVDGAHIPGHLPLNLSQLQADIYTGACHKWLLTPKGCSFLYVHPTFQSIFDPLVISWGYDSDTPSGSQFIDYHQLQGTRDISAFLTVPKALQFRATFNWDSESAKARHLAHKNYTHFAHAANGRMLCSATPEFLGQMCSAEINCIEPEALNLLLYQKYKIEVPTFANGNTSFIRYSFQAYNTQEELNRLFNALEDIRKTTNLISNERPNFHEK